MQKYKITFKDDDEIIYVGSKDTVLSIMETMEKDGDEVEMSEASDEEVKEYESGCKIEVLRDGETLVIGCNEVKIGDYVTTRHDGVLHKVTGKTYFDGMDDMVVTDEYHYSPLCLV